MRLSRPIDSKHQTLFALGAIFAFLCYLVPFITSHTTIVALILGIIISNTSTTANKLNLEIIRKSTLNTAIVLFGFGLNINVIIKVGSTGIILTFISLLIVISSGYMLIKAFKIDKKTGQLITYGTSICGGSAIAATACVLRANTQQISISMGCIFALNGIALLFFPLLGRWLGLSSDAFGVLCALAIHDVSSVVGAASQFSQEALETATVLKLTRILWMIPIIIILGKFNKIKNNKIQDNKTQGKNIKTSFPIFILFFIAASLITSFFPLPFAPFLITFGKMLLALALYFIGYNVNLTYLKTMGLTAIGFAIVLWMISIISALCLVYFWY